MKLLRYPEKKRSLNVTRIRKKKQNDQKGQVSDQNIKRIALNEFNQQLL